MVINSGKYVMLFIYAPWCGHCKKLHPTYEKLAKDLAKRNDIILTKMDGTANEVEGISIQGFPTLKFYKKGDPKPIDFDGDRSYDSFIKFFNKYLEEKIPVQEKKKDAKKEENNKDKKDKDDTKKDTDL